MAAQTIIVLKDHLDANVTFSPKGSRMTGPGKTQSVWKETSASTALGYLTLTETHTAAGTSGISKMRYVIQLPSTVTDPATGITKLGYYVAASLEVFEPDVASEAELSRVVALLKTLTSSAYFGNAIVKREPAW